MTYNQFRAALGSLEISQVGAAKLFRVNGRTVRRWALGERRIPDTVAILLRLLIAGKITTADVEGAK